MHERLRRKLDALRRDPSCGEFIIADAKDADMAWGISSPGAGWPASGGRMRSMSVFHQEIRRIVEQGEVDIMLASVSTMSRLAHQERLFDRCDVTPAIRANDTTDTWVVRGGRYVQHPSVPFATCHIREAQHGTLTPAEGQKPAVNLGLYSVTFTNDLDADLHTLETYRAFRADAAKHGFRHFLEVFAPNVEAGLAPDQIPAYVNDMICRMLAGVPLAERPEFLKIPFFGPGALEELVAYDPSLVVGVLGGSSGTTLDAFKLLAEAQKHGARIALFGRKIKDAEDPLAFIRFLRRIVKGEFSPEEAVKAYHAELDKAGVAPRRPLQEDLALTTNTLSYLN